MAKSTFEAAIGAVLAHEGGYSNHPNDTGGATNHGITINVARGYGSLADFDRDGDVDARDMQLMPLEFAKQVYRDRYWNALYELLGQSLASKVFDTAVNCGPSQAHKFLQRALVSLGQTVGVDGALGPQTMAKAVAVPEGALLGAFRAQQKAFYESLVKAKPSQGVFLKGWLRRAAA